MMAADQQHQQQQLPAAFNQFISLMNKEEAKDLVRSINMFMKDFKQRPPNAETDSAAVQSFLQQMETAMAKHPLFANSTPAEQDAATEALEKYLMTKLHERTFRAAPSDVERDDSLAVRCAALGGFVRPAHLEIPDGLVDEEAAGRAAAELNRINVYKAPRDKMVCILNCCRMINSLLANTGKAEGIGADDFTPLLIYVVIRAQTPQLASNLAYIERYRHHAKLSSETQYYYIQLCGAATFIEMIDATSLKVDRDEFIAHMLAAGAMTDEQLASLQSSDSREVAAAAAAAADSAAWPAQGAAAAAGGTQQQVRAALEVPLLMQALPSQQQQQQVPAAAAPPVYPGLLELEAEGAALLSLRGDATSAEAMVGRHPYCCSALDSLSMRDVGQLLAAYKELVLRYECLAAVLEHYAAHQQPPNGTACGSSSRAQAQQQQQQAEVQHAPAVLSPIAESSMPAAVDALQLQAAEPQQQQPAAVQDAAAAPPAAAAAAEGAPAVPAVDASLEAPGAAVAATPPEQQQLGGNSSEVDDLLKSLLVADGGLGFAQTQQQQQQQPTREPQGQQPVSTAVAAASAAAGADDDMFVGMFVTPASSTAAVSLLD